MIFKKEKVQSNEESSSVEFFLKRSFAEIWDFATSQNLEDISTLIKAKTLIKNALYQRLQALFGVNWC